MGANESITSREELDLMQADSHVCVVVHARPWHLILVRMAVELCMTRQALGGSGFPPQKISG
jgi:hypothetical protein